MSDAGLKAVLEACPIKITLMKYLKILWHELAIFQDAKNCLKMLAISSFTTNTLVSKLCIS